MKFAWFNKNSKNWRKCLAGWAQMMGFEEPYQIKQIFGNKWAFHLNEEIHRFRDILENNLGDMYKKYIDNYIVKLLSTKKRRLDWLNDNMKNIYHYRKADNGNKEEGNLHLWADYVKKYVQEKRQFRQLFVGRCGPWFAGAFANTVFSRNFLKFDRGPGCFLVSEHD
jgi:hypothetical protein